jgi:hypothetical protein
MPADNDISDTNPMQTDRIGWRRGLQLTDFRRLSADQLREYELPIGVTPLHADNQGDEDVGGRVANFEACASRYYARRTEMTSPERADRRGEAVRIADAARLWLQALDDASDITLDSLDKLGGEVGASHRAVTKMLTAAAELSGPGSAGRPSHEHLDDFVYELATMIDVFYDVELKVYFTDAGQPIPAVSEFLWRLVKHFDPGVDEGSLRTAMKRAKQRSGKVD